MSETLVNLHCHGMFSAYDGYGSAKQQAKYAAEMGQTALGLTDHGTVSGLIDHYRACQEAGIKPILGYEGYFVPSYEKMMEKESANRKYHHITVFAMNTQGYHDLMKAVSVSSREKFYRKPLFDFETFEKYGENWIVLSGCVAGYIPRMIQKGRDDLALKAIKRFKKILGDRFYLEVQPVFGLDIQEVTNEFLLSHADKLGLKTAMTFDSHFVSKSDYDTYVIMHKLNGHDPYADYTRRYLHSESEAEEAWSESDMDYSFEPLIETTNEIAERCNVDLSFQEMIPTIDWGMPSKKKLTKLAVEGLKSKNAWTSEYKKQLRYELDVIFEKGFTDYFLLVYDIVQYAIDNGIGIGFGRGSVCGSLLAYAIDLTNVDPLVLGTVFERFLRPNKTEMPDIDMDFDNERRGEVIDYIMSKYAGKVLPISNFGYYKVKNLFNDLAKLYEIPKEESEAAKGILEGINEESLNELPKLMKNKRLRELNIQYTSVMKHFSKLYGQVRFIGRHAAGIAVTDGDIERYAAAMRIRSEYQTAYDLKMLKEINVVKMDILGLKTVTVMREIEALTGASFSYDILDDQETYEAFGEGMTAGVFQFEKPGAIDVLMKVKPKNIQELMACSGLNRPAPIKLGILAQFVAVAQGEVEVDKTKPWYPMTAETNGVIVYQEQVMRICRELAHMDWADTDKVMKALKPSGNGPNKLLEGFINGAVEHAQMQPSEARELYENMTLYLFNKGHAAGYTLLSFYMMWLKKRFPLEFWFATLKHESADYERAVYRTYAVQEGIVLLLPHVNGGADDTIVDIEGERCIREGMRHIKRVGLKTAQLIEASQPYDNRDELISRIPKRNLTSAVIEALDRDGATEFNDETYYARVEKYNAWIYGRNLRMR